LKKDISEYINIFLKKLPK